MTERNEMPTPVPMWLREAVCAELRKDGGVWPVNEFHRIPGCRTLARLLWGRGEREPVDPDLIEARAIETKYCETGPMTRVEMVLIAIKRGRELAEAKP